MMFKKFFLLFLLLFCGCSKKEAETVIETEEYIAPVRNVFLFDELSASTQEKMKAANNGSELKNYQLKMIGKDLYEGILYDIYGNAVDLSDHDRILLEVMSSECSHCKKQVEEHLEETKAQDATLIQYFDKGNLETIEEFYEELDMEVPDDVIIISNDSGFFAYLRETLGVEYFPTTICFLDGKLTFDMVGNFDENCLKNIMRLGFDQPLSQEELCNSEGVDIRELDRSVDDVKNSLSQENREKLADLDNDDYTKELTYECMGSTLDFDNLINTDDTIHISQIEDYGYYATKKLVLIYTYFHDESESDKISFINELIENNEGYEYIVVLIEGFESSSVLYEKMDIDFVCPVVSVLGRMPEDFFRYGLIEYPTALFVDRGTFTGGYSNIQGSEELKKALEMFLSADSIALVKNN